MLQRTKNQVILTRAMRDDEAQAFTYLATPEEFAKDLATIGMAQLPAMPEGATHQTYEPGVRHAFASKDGSLLDVEDKFPREWTPGDEVLAATFKLAKAKLDRQHAAMIDRLNEQHEKATRNLESTAANAA